LYLYRAGIQPQIGDGLHQSHHGHILSFCFAKYFYLFLTLSSGKWKGAGVKGEELMRIP
jgi:hypothetical protein